MSERTDRPAAKDPSLEPGSKPAPPDGVNGSGPDAKPEFPLPNHAVPSDDPTEMLKRDLEATRLPPDLREEILAELPPPEERARMYRELIENGGLSFEECFGPLLAELEGPK